MFILTKPIKSINIGDAPLAPLPRPYKLTTGEDLIAPHEPIVRPLIKNRKPTILELLDNMNAKEKTSFLQNMKKDDLIKLIKELLKESGDSSEFKISYNVKKDDLIDLTKDLLDRT